MKKNNKDIGKGIDGLFSNIDIKRKKKDSDSKTEGNGIVEINIDEIVENSHQPRIHFDPDALIQLSASIKENGILQPLTVIKKEDKKYELIAGERRLRASRLAGLTSVPVIIMEEVDQKKKSVLALIENVQREDLNPLEVANSLKKMMDDFNLKHDEIAKKVGIPRSNVSNYIRILNLPEETLELIKIEKLSLGHAKVLLSLKDKDKINELANLVVQKQLSIAKLNKLLKKDEEENKEESKKEESSLSENVIKRASELKENYNLKLTDKKITIAVENEEEILKILDLLSKK